MIYYIYNQDQIVGFIYNGITYYYHKNILGDIIGILNTDYQEIVKYTYDAYGNILSIVDNSNINLGEINPFRYRSYYYDTETQLYYLNSRYYNPTTGRFINADSELHSNDYTVSHNLFAYCNNNSITYIDIKGTSIKEKIKNYFKEKEKKAKKIIKAVIENDVTPVLDVKGGLGFYGGLGLSPLNTSVGFDKSVGWDNINGPYVSTSGSLMVENFGIGADIKTYDEGFAHPLAMPWDAWNHPRTYKSLSLMGKTTNIFGDDIDNTANIEYNSDDTVFVGFEFGTYVFAGINVKIGASINLDN